MARLCSVVSTGKSLIDIIIKRSLFPRLDEEIRINHHYFSQLDDQSLVRHIVLLVPGIGNIAVALFDLFAARFCTKERIRGLSFLAPLCFKLAPYDTRNDPDFAKELADRYYDLIPYLTKRLQRDDVVIKELVSFRSGHFAYASKEQQNNPEIAAIALEKNASNLEYAGLAISATTAKRL